jgi:hypothetical protein
MWIAKNIVYRYKRKINTQQNRHTKWNKTWNIESNYLKKTRHQQLAHNRFYINPFPNKPWFLCVCSTSLLKTQWEKEKLLVTSNFSFSHSVFYLFWKHLYHFQQIWNCRLQTLSVWKRLKLVVWERVNPFPHNDSFW